MVGRLHPRCRRAPLVGLGLVLVGAAGAADPPSTLEIPSYTFELNGDHVKEWEAILRDLLALRTAAPFASAFAELLGEARAADPATVATFAAELPRWAAALPAEESEAAQMLGRVLRERAPQDGISADDPRLSDDSVLLNQLLMPILESEPAAPQPGGRVRPPWAADAAGGCTSILAAQPGTGRVVLARNHDFGARTALANTTAVVRFLRSGVRQYDCLATLPWITKVSTCVRPGAFAFALNARMQGIDVERGTSPEELLRRLEGGMLRRQTLLRRMMEAESYSVALALAATLPVLDSMYIILAGAGPWEGAVVTRAANSTRSEIFPLSPVPDLPSDSTQHNWFRVQTNVDHWAKTGPYATHRRDHAIELVAALGQELASTPEGLFSVLQNRTATFNWDPASGTGEDTGAILRPDTVLTAAMVPADGTLIHKVWAVDPVIEGWTPPHAAQGPASGRLVV